MSVSDNSTAAVSYEEDGAYDTAHGEDIPKSDRVRGFSPSHISPYAESEIIHIDVGSSSTRFLVHSLMLRKSPPLFALASKDRFISLPKLNEEPAHTLVHYLYTGTFETRLRYPPIGRFVQSSCVYCTAIQYQLPTLAALSKEKIVEVGESLPVMDVLEVARDYAFPMLPEADVWYSQYLEGIVQKAMSRDPEPFRRPDFLNSVEGNSRLLQIVWKIVMSNYTAVPAVATETPLRNDVETPLAESLLTESEAPTQNSLHQLPSPTDSAVNSPLTSKEAGIIDDPEPLHLNSPTSAKLGHATLDAAEEINSEPQIDTAVNNDYILPAIEPTTKAVTSTNVLKSSTALAEEPKKSGHGRSDSVVEEVASTPDSSFELAKRAQQIEPVPATNNGNIEMSKKNKKKAKKGRS